MCVVQGFTGESKVAGIKEKKLEKGLERIYNNRKRKFHRFRTTVMKVEMRDRLNTFSRF